MTVLWQVDLELVGRPASGGGVRKAKVGGNESVWEPCKRGKNEEGEVGVGGEGRRQMGREM